MGKQTLKGLLVKMSMVSAAVTLVAGIGVTIMASPAVAAPLPTTRVTVPANGATLSGLNATLDATASNATSVQFRLFGGNYFFTDVCNAKLTSYGWLCGWNTYGVPNGTYTLFSLVYNSANAWSLSSGLSITVNNPPTSTSVLVPKNNATISGTTTLDAGAVNGTSVAFYYQGTNSLLPNGEACSALATPYGWACLWNTSIVPNGTYEISSYVVSSISGHAAYSPSVIVTVKN